MKRLIVIYFIFIFIFQVCIEPQKVYAKTRGMSSLRIGIGGRAVGMGEAFSAVSEGAISTYWNPAGLVGTNGMELETAHNQWLFDVTSEFVSFASKFNNYAWGLSFYYTDLGKIEARTYRNEKDPIGVFSANDVIIGTSFAKEINKKFNFGLTIKYVYEKIYIESASGFAFDLGAKYYVFEDILCAGFVIKNVGFMDKMRDKKLSPPTAYRLGVMYDVSNIFNKKDFLIVSSDYEILPDYKDNLMIGAEVKINNKFALRSGYQSGFENRNFCCGIGLGFNILKIDYGFTPFSSELGNTHRFSIKFNW